MNITAKAHNPILSRERKPFTTSAGTLARRRPIAYERLSNQMQLNCAGNGERRQ